MPRTKSSTWFIETLDQHSNRKTVGGDEFTVIFMAYKNMDDKSTIPRSKYETPTATALVQDQRDGTYTLDWVRSPYGLKRPSKETHTNHRNEGVIYVYLHYTCDMGRLTLPLKKDWRKGGGLLNSMYYQSNVTAPPMRQFQRPPFIDLSQFTKVICLGDSVLRNMCGAKKKIGATTFKKKNIKVADNVGQFLCNTSHLEAAFDLLDRSFGMELNATTNTAKDKIAILVGHYAWDAHANLEPPGHFFSRSLARSARIVQRLREKHPNVTILWKGPHAIHLTMLDWKACMGKTACRERVRYMSDSIGKYVHQQQKQIMHDLKVPYLDMYEASEVAGSAWNLDGDAVHYRSWFNMLMIDLFYPRHLQFKSSVPWIKNMQLTANSPHDPKNKNISLIPVIPAPGSEATEPAGEVGPSNASANPGDSDRPPQAPTEGRLLGLPTLQNLATRWPV